jgi:hypothetical protein
MRREVGVPGPFILWRRLDAPGHDACCLEQTEGGWQLEGTAVFRENGVAALLAYRVRCDSAWRTQHGQVDGWLGAQPVSFTVARTTGGVWTLNDVPITGLENCVDLDFGFTPATNLLQLRRIDLSPGQSADVPVAWLDASSTTLEMVPQRYERRTEGTYWYESPRFDYDALLEVTPTGFVQRYPGLWEAEGEAATDDAE